MLLVLLGLAVCSVPERKITGVVHNNLGKNDEPFLTLSYPSSTRVKREECRGKKEKKELVKGEIKESCMCQRADWLTL